MIAMKNTLFDDRRGLSVLTVFLALLAVVCGANLVKTFAGSNAWTPKESIEPAALAQQLKKSTNKPLLLHVGFRRLYDQGHIPGSQYCGPAFRADGIAKLKESVKGVPHTRAILIYCGCCPWEDCPNVRPAFETLREMGFTHVQVLYIPHNFGRDWAQKGYPTE
jgi:thiosulfate/3-mercaptopyruvate sulfurtransferase